MKNNEIIQKLDQLIKDEVEQDIDGIKTLYEQLNIARQSFEEYQRKGIPISISKIHIVFFVLSILDNIYYKNL